MRYAECLGPKDKPPVATGMDVAVFENGKIRSLYVFLDS
jgi:HAE1 family hydrophobic/amphiphilic exporter-1